MNAAPELFSLREHLSVDYDDLAVTAELDGIDDAGALDDGFEAGAMTNVADIALS